MAEKQDGSVRSEKSGGGYADIRDLSYPRASHHLHMTMENRAAQFAPFAALTGYAEEIREASRLTEEEKEAGEDAADLLDRKLRILAAHPDAEVTISYFVPDEKKQGGAYAVYTGRIRGIDSYAQVLMTEEKKGIPIARIRDMQGELFAGQEEEM